jgi:hypothetical protein
MKVNLSYWKPNFILVIVLIFILNSGCTSYRIISSYDLPDPGRYHYTVYLKNAYHPLENTVIANDTLSGFVSIKHISYINSIRIYPASDSMVKINPSNILTIPMAGIARVEQSGNAETKSHPAKKANKPKAPAGAIILGILTTCAALIVVNAWPSLNK